MKTCICKIRKLNKTERRKKRIMWQPYPSPKKEGFGNGKFCYFISCPDSKLPLRDYVYQKKKEPHYEDKSYNVYASCNQYGIKNAKKRGISYLIFCTRYQGIKERYKNLYFITGLFPISESKKINAYVAYHSKKPIFLSIEDSIELNNRTWQKWFKTNIPKDKRYDTPNLHYITKFVTKDSIALKEILNHFKKKKHKNKIVNYIKELCK